MAKYKTKYFGEVTFDNSTEHLGIDLKFKNHVINILFSDKSIYTDKINTCLNIIDAYFDINIISKNAILNNYQKSNIIKTYFEDCFNNFDEKYRIKAFCTNEYTKMNFEHVVEKLEYPNLYFCLNSNNNELLITSHYILSNECSFGRSNILSVNLDEHLNVLEFKHGKVLID
jgi:hypothetical protein